MNIDPMWIIGTGASVLGVGVGAYIKVTERLTRMETMMSIISKKAASILISPHTPELDALLVEYVESHFDLPMAKWERMEHLVLEIENDKNRGKDERVLAAMVAALADHKLSRYRTKKTVDNGPKPGDVQGA